MIYTNLTHKSTLIKRDIVVLISDQTGLTQQEVKRVIELLLDNVTDHLKQGRAVTFRNFGTFEPRFTKPKVGRNPRDPGKDLIIPPRPEVRFQAGKDLKEQVAQLPVND